LGSICGLRNTNQIHQLASSVRVSEFLSKHFLINAIPSYFWLLCLLRLAEPGSLNRCFMVVVDALNCQKETAAAVIKGKGDYLLSVKDNQQTLKEDIEGYVQDRHLQETMDTHATVDKTSGRIERRTAYTNADIGWMAGWKG
jgi:hypothetical protein